MIRTIVSIFITLAILVGVSAFELFYVDYTFKSFHEILLTLYDKVESATATHEDGLIVKNYWQNKKEILHIWVPHTALQEMDLQLNESIGYIYLQDYESAQPKLEVLIGLSEDIPRSYKIGVPNIF